MNEGVEVIIGVVVGFPLLLLIGWIATQIWDYNEQMYWPDSSITNH